MKMIWLYEDGIPYVNCHTEREHMTGFRIEVTEDVLSRWNSIEAAWNALPDEKEMLLQIARRVHENHLDT